MIVILFNVRVTQILLYYADILVYKYFSRWCPKNEKCYLRNFKRIFGVPLSTATCAVYFELGQLLVETMVKSTFLNSLQGLEKMLLLGTCILNDILRVSFSNCRIMYPIIYPKFHVYTRNSTPVRPIKKLQRYKRCRFTSW